MTDIGYTIQGLDEILAKLNGTTLMGKPVTQAFHKSAIAVQNEARQRAPVDRGQLRNRITYVVDAAPIPRHARIGVKLDYAQTMNDGRRAGARMPPVKAIEQWLRRVRSSAPPFVVARSIGRKGIKGKKFMEGGLQAATGHIQRAFAQAAREIEAQWRR